MVTVADASTTSLWLDRLDPPVAPRPPLEGDRQVDVAIVGGGFSGLWTAYYLCRANPGLRVLVVEREHCGFGASGRNGGWCVGELGGSFDRYAARSTASEARRLVRAVFDAVDEVGRVAVAEGIDCGYAKGGTIRVARTEPQARRQREEVAHHHALGFTAEEVRLLDAAEATAVMNATDVRSGIFLAPSAALDPAQLIRGLALAVERLGGTIVEQTAVTAIGDRTVETVRGTIRAGAVVRATEAYTRDLAGARRDLVPVYSLMIATEPLEPAIFDEIGLAGRPTFSDDRYMVIYGQRTADARIAFGGRGVPYLYGSRIDRATETHQRSHELIRRTLVELFPVLAGARITHRWGGVLGIPRNWLPGLRFDPAAGHGVLGGYVGEGVAASNLAGRTMAELVAGLDTERTSLPWVGVRSRRWEIEPFRWLGIRGSRWILGAADERERRTGREAKLAARVVGLLR
jgi:glycine/D-amino acid oxidase-like deaminating enzyme